MIIQKIIGMNDGILETRNKIILRIEIEKLLIL